MAAEASKEEQGGELLFCGGAGWEFTGRSKGTDYNGQMILAPTRLRPLLNVSISFVASGSNSCHCVALDVDGRCFTWGRNERGQLGHGDQVTRDKPTVVTGLKVYKIIKAGAGRNHTVVVTDQGDSFSFGCNKHGQLGTGSVKNDVEVSPVQCLVTQATHAACGADFTVWLSSMPKASILTAGLPQYGQLGHGTDNEYNAKESSVKLAYEPQPRPRAISSFADKTITKVACGNNHTVAVDSNGHVYSWGFGGHGRLGHREQKDEWAPRMIEQFQRHNVVPPSGVVAAGSAFSACTASGDQLYMWGRVKMTGDNWMYPKPVYDLSGWSIRCMDCGDRASVVGAEKSCISWGQATYGELGYGASGPKSSASAKKIDLLEGMHVSSVACGLGHTLIIVDRTNVMDRLDKFDVYDGRDNSEAAAEVTEAKSDKKRKTNSENVDDKAVDESEAANNILNGDKKPRGRPPKKAKEILVGQTGSAKIKARGRPPKKQVSSEDESIASEDDEDEQEEDEEHSGGKKMASKPRSGKGRGRGSGSKASAQLGNEESAGQAQGTSRGRGRGRGGRGR